MPQDSIYCTELTTSVDPLQVGGKASNLAKAAALGIRIAGGFVITRQALTHFLEENRLTASVQQYVERDWENRNEQQQNYARLCSAVLSAPLPDALRNEAELFARELLAAAPSGLAVRSSGVHEDSAAASFAGVFKSFLGISTLEALWDKIRSCWCSGWTPQAIRYARRKQIDLQPDQIAIIVQAVIPAESSGIIFTADPLTGNPWRFILNSTWGLARDIVEGAAPADRFLLEWDTAEILESQVAQKPAALVSDGSGIKEVLLSRAQSRMPSLSASEISQVGQMALQLDRAYDQRLDIEWALQRGELYLIQARPITALPTFFPHELSAAGARLTWALSDPAWYTKADEEKSLVAPLFRDRWALELWHRNLAPGDIFPRRVGHERDFNGYRYSTDWQWQTGPNDRVWIEQWLNQNEAKLEQDWLAQKAKVIRVCRQIAEAQGRAAHSTDLIPLLLECYRAEEEMQAAVWAAPQWMSFTCEHLLKGLIQEIMPGFAFEKLLQGLPSYSYERTKAAQGLAYSLQEDLVREIFIREPVETILSSLLQHCPGSRFLKDFTAFCWQFGVCPPDLPKPWSHWSQDLTPVLFTIKSTVLGQGQDAGAMLSKSMRERKAQEELLYIQAAQSDLEAQRQLDRILAWAYFWVPVLDDRSWHYVILTRLAALMHQTGDTLRNEGLLDQSTDILLLTVDHLSEIAKAQDVRQYRGLYLAQKHEFESQKRLTPPQFLGASSNLAPPEREAAPIARPVSSAKGSFQGEGFSPGKATGLSMKIEALTDAVVLSSLTGERILICPKAKDWRPDWLSLFLVIKGLVAVGGVQLQHAAQLARECAIPFVNLPEEDWNNVPDHTQISIDGEAGLVTVLE